MHPQTVPLPMQFHLKPMQWAGIHKFRQKEVLWTPLWISYANKHNIQMETGQKYFVNRALRYFLLDMVRDGKSVAKSYILSEKILIRICMCTHKCMREWHVKFLTHYKMRWQKLRNVLWFQDHFSPKISFLFPAFLQYCFQLHFLLFSKQKYSKCEMSEFQKWKNFFF